jgi:hypothetical protein
VSGSEGMPEPAPEPTHGPAPEVRARPIATARIANISAAVAFVVFVIVAIVMRTANAGATFELSDQLGTVVLGLIVAGGLHIPARPRMRADTQAVYLRSYLGTWRTVPWEAVVAVEFPAAARFARLRLPAEEILAIYAVQRADGAVAVEAMRGLRQLFAATHSDAA